jgi:hypothetical protein
VARRHRHAQLTTAVRVLIGVAAFWVLGGVVAENRPWWIGALSIVVIALVVGRS